MDHEDEKICISDDDEKICISSDDDEKICISSDDDDCEIVCELSSQQANQDSTASDSDNRIIITPTLDQIRKQMINKYMLGNMTAKHGPLKKEKHKKQHQCYKKQKIDDILNEDLSATVPLENRSLCVEGFGRDCSPETIKAFSSDIVNVQKRKDSLLAVLEFRNETITEQYYNILSDTIVNDRKLIVDYQKVAIESPHILYLTGLPAKTSVEDIKKTFPTAKECVLPQTKYLGHGTLADKNFALITFENSADAAEVHDGKEYVINGKIVTAIFAKAFQIGKLRKRVLKKSHTM